MIIINNNLNLTDKTCVALGNFDGVHLGHARIIEQTVLNANKKNLTSCVYTFNRHPSELLGLNKTILTDNEDKIDLIDSLGCDALYLDDFESIRNMSPHDFCVNILKNKLNAEYVFCGENYTFGYLGKGNTEILKHELDKLEINLIIVPYVYDKDNKIVSSTLIRNLIETGKINEANLLLGHKYNIKGKVTTGKKLGRKLGFPTLNLGFPPNKTIPEFGVYISMCYIDGIKYNGITNIGKRPTTDSSTDKKDLINCETFLFDFDEDAYNKFIEVKLVEKIRDEIRFTSIDELVSQIKKDTSFAISYFSNSNKEC